MARDKNHTLQIRGLQVFYGSSHALQGVDITLSDGIHAVLGRNGMGKTTLCNTVMGLKEASGGSIKFNGRELTSMASHQIAGLGIGYTPQGRRLWPSLTVDEHLRLCQKKNSAWTLERIYDQFPRLAERRGNGGAQLSGGEQQMLAISRALLANPELLVLDEPTEGLAPVIVDQVVELLKSLASEGDVAILLVEQNIKVATEVAENVAIMVNGKISHVLPAAQLAGDRSLQQRLLGVGRLDENDRIEIPAYQPDPRETVSSTASAKPESTKTSAPQLSTKTARATGWAYIPPARWDGSHWESGKIENNVTPLISKTEPIRTSHNNAVLVAGTFDTKSEELNFMRDRIRDHGVAVRTVDLSTSGKPSSANIPPHVIAACHPRGSSAVFTGDRGTAVAAMTQAFETWAKSQDNIGGIVSAAGSGGTALVTPAMRALSVGVPKVMVSTVASGDVGPYVGPSDIMMMYSITDVAGINNISAKVLSNAADAIAGMAKTPEEHTIDEKPAIGLTMFGVTTPAVQQIMSKLENDCECLVFHATGTGGRSMEKLADSGLLTAAMDITTTEVCDHIVGGVFAADEDRFGSFIRTKTPWVGSVGALDMVNFGAPETVPEKFSDRLFYEHNPQVTLMRTTPEENRLFARFITERVNRMTGPVRFLIPELGVSALDKAGQPFDDPEAREALYSTIVSNFQQTANKRLIRVPYHINDPEFTEAAVAALYEVTTIEKRGVISAAI